MTAWSVAGAGTSSSACEGNTHTESSGTPCNQSKVLKPRTFSQRAFTYAKAFLSLLILVAMVVILNAYISWDSSSSAS